MTCFRMRRRIFEQDFAFDGASIYLQMNVWRATATPASRRVTGPHRLTAEVAVHMFYPEQVLSRSRKQWGIFDELL